MHSKLLCQRTHEQSRRVCYEQALERKEKRRFRLAGLVKLIRENENVLYEFQNTDRKYENGRNIQCHGEDVCPQTLSILSLGRFMSAVISKIAFVEESKRMESYNEPFCSW